jgi:hypothetical protein
VPLEVNTQGAFIGHLRKKGFECVKRGQQGEPDWEVSRYDFPRRRVWIEFKQHGAPFTVAQLRRFPKMIAQGEAIFIVTERSPLVEIGLALCDCLIEDTNPVPPDLSYASHS